MDPTLLAQIMGSAPQMEQMQQGDQQLADVIARRKAAAAQPAYSGSGALLGGLADIIMGRKESGLRQQHMDLANQIAQKRGQWGQDYAAASAPVQAPPDMLAAPGFDRATQERDQQQKLAGLKMQGMLSGDPLVSGYLQHAPGMEMQDLNLAKTREEMTANNSPEAGAANRILLKKFGFEMPETTPSATLRALLPSAEKGYAADQTREGRLESARIMAGARITAAGMGGGGPQIDDDALNQAAEMYSRTGQLPSLGGAAGSVLKRQIVSRAAQLHPEADIAGNKAGYKADTTSLAKLQTQTDSLNAFERTALANLDQFLQQAHQVVDTGSPLFNAPARKFMQSVAGDPKMAQFNAARQVAVQEISKVLGGSLGGVVSDSARHEASGLLTPDASLAQIEAAANVLRRDMANRRASMQTEIAGVRGRASGKAPAAEAMPAPGAAPAQAPAGMAHPQDSAAVQWAKSHPNDPRAQKILQINGVQ